MVLAIAFSTCTNFPNIQKVELSDNRLTEVGENAMKGFLIINLIQKGIKESEEGMICDLSNLGIGDLECDFIANYDGFDDLKHLYLELNKITEVGMQKISDSEKMKGLTLLSLDRNKIGDKGVESIVTSNYLNGLTHLMIENNDITDNGMNLISSSENMSCLIRLYIDGNHHTDSGFNALGDSEYLKQLEYPEFDRGEIEMEVAEEEEEFEDIEIEDVEEEEVLEDED